MLSLDPTLLEIDAGRVLDELREFAAISSTPSDDVKNVSVTRILWSDEDLRARELLRRKMQDAELQVYEDPIGNIFGRLDKSGGGARGEIFDRSENEVVATGSHIDAIPYSGMYDGTVGVIGALEAFRAVAKYCKVHNITLRRSIDLIMFTAEEPTRFGIGCLGSRLMSQKLEIDNALALKDQDQTSVAVWRQRVNYDASMADVAVRDGAYSAFIELHIEQGPILERENIDIGIVTAIAAPASLRMTLTGPGGHAGAVLMNVRRDPLLVAARIILMVDRIARTSGGPDTVATVGVVKVHPGAINSIPREVTIELDIRDIELERRTRLIDQLFVEAKSAAAEMGNDLTIEWISADPPAICDERLVDMVEDTAGKLGYSNQRMISRAYHDSLFMAHIIPTTMIFIPCRDGVSHRPEEFSSVEAIQKGVRTLAGALLSLAVA